MFLFPIAFPLLAVLKNGRGLARLDANLTEVTPRRPKGRSHESITFLLKQRHLCLCKSDKHEIL